MDKKCLNCIFYEPYSESCITTERWTGDNNYCDGFTPPEDPDPTFFQDLGYYEPFDCF
jgi:hypothetical protein